MSVIGLNNISYSNNELRGYQSGSVLQSNSPSITTETGYTDKVIISNEAKALAQEADIQSKLDTIKAKPIVERTPDEVEFVNDNDKRLAKIREKDPQKLTAEELDYQQKAGGFVNTMATLSTSEKALYNELVAKGDYEAAAGMNLIALARTGMEGQKVQLPNGQSFDPTKTEITASNIRNFFQYMFVDSTGEMSKRFEALASYLENRSTSNDQKS